MDDAKLLADCDALQHTGGDVLARLAELARAVCARARVLKEDEQKLKEEWARLQAEREKFASECASVQQLNAQASDRIVLDVGGKVYATTRATLCAFPTSMLAAWFSGRHAIQTRDDGSVFIDRSPVLFEYVLDYLRTQGECPLFPTEENGRERLRADFEFFCLPWPDEPAPSVLDLLQGELECVTVDVNTKAELSLEMYVAANVLVTHAKDLHSGDVEVSVWDTYTGERMRGSLNSSAEETLQAISVSWDGKFVVGARQITDTEANITVLRTQDGARMTSITCDVLPVSTALFGNSDVVLSASGNNDTQLSAYSVSTGRCLWTKNLDAAFWRIYHCVNNKDVFVVHVLEGDDMTNVLYVYDVSGALLYEAGAIPHEYVSISIHLVGQELRVLATKANEGGQDITDLYLDRWNSEGTRLLNGCHLLRIPPVNFEKCRSIFNGPDTVCRWAATTLEIIQLAFPDLNSAIVSKQVSVRLAEPEYWGGVYSLVCLGSVVAVRGPDRRVKVWTPRKEEPERKRRKTGCQ